MIAEYRVINDSIETGESDNLLKDVNDTNTLSDNNTLSDKVQQFNSTSVEPCNYIADLENDIVYFAPAIAILLVYMPMSWLMKKFGAYYVVATSLLFSGLVTAFFESIINFEFGGSLNDNYITIKISKS